MTLAVYNQGKGIIWTCPFGCREFAVPIFGKNKTKPAAVVLSGQLLPRDYLETFHWKKTEGFKAVFETPPSSDGEEGEMLLNCFFDDDLRKEIRQAPLEWGHELNYMKITVIIEGLRLLEAAFQENVSEYFVEKPEIGITVLESFRDEQISRPAIARFSKKISSWFNYLFPWGGVYLNLYGSTYLRFSKGGLLVSDIYTQNKFKLDNSTLYVGGKCQVIDTQSPLWNEEFLYLQHEKKYFFRDYVSFDASACGCISLNSPSLAADIPWEGEKGAIEGQWPELNTWVKAKYEDDQEVPSIDKESVLAQTKTRNPRVIINEMLRRLAEMGGPNPDIAGKDAFDRFISYADKYFDESIDYYDEDSPNAEKRLHHMVAHLFASPTALTYFESRRKIPELLKEAQDIDLDKVNDSFLARWYDL